MMRIPFYDIDNNCLIDAGEVKFVIGCLFRRRPEGSAEMRIDNI
jgi:hypothetical protein